MLKTFNVTKNFTKWEYKCYGVILLKIRMHFEILQPVIFSLFVNINKLTKIVI